VDGWCHETHGHPRPPRRLSRYGAECGLTSGLVVCVGRPQTSFGNWRIKPGIPASRRISPRTGKISLPTPIMAGVRTPTKQFASCTVLEAGDSLDSINAATSAIVKYISQRAGIGINGGRIRALGSEIRGGEAVHTGVIPFWKMFQAAVKSCSQGKLCPAY